MATCASGRPDVATGCAAVLVSAVTAAVVLLVLLVLLVLVAMVAVVVAVGAVWRSAAVVDPVNRRTGFAG